MIQILQNGSKLLRNFGTVAFMDVKSPNYPTFPVFHATHLMIFGSTTAFDPFFINSFADPWINDVYVSFNSSFIAKNVKLYNFIGGDWNFKPRYSPVNMAADEYIEKVQLARRKIAQWIGRKSPTFTWNPSELAYGEEGIYYEFYCGQQGRDSGCRGNRCSAKAVHRVPQSPSYRVNCSEL